MKLYIVKIEYQANIESKNKKLALKTLVNKITKGGIKAKASIVQFGKS